MDAIILGITKDCKPEFENLNSKILKNLIRGGGPMGDYGVREPMGSGLDNLNIGGIL
jgi:hypothetical protein